MDLKQQMEATNLNPASRAGHPDHATMQAFKRWDWSATASVSPAGLEWVELEAVNRATGGTVWSGGVEHAPDGGLLVWPDGSADVTAVADAFEAQVVMAGMALAQVEGGQ